MENFFIRPLALWIKLTILCQQYKIADNQQKINKLNRLCVLFLIPSYVLLIAIVLLTVVAINRLILFLFHYYSDWLFIIVFIILSIAIEFLLYILACYYVRNLRFSSLEEESSFFVNIKHIPHSVYRKLAEDKHNIYCIIKYFRNEEKTDENNVRIDYGCFTKYGEKIGSIVQSAVFRGYETITLKDNGSAVVVNRYINSETGDSLLVVSTDGNIMCKYSDKLPSIVDRIILEEINELYNIYLFLEEKKDVKPNYIMINSCKYTLKSIDNNSPSVNKTKFY